MYIFLFILLLKERIVGVAILVNIYYVFSSKRFIPVKLIPCSTMLREPKWYSRQGSCHKTWVCLFSQDDKSDKLLGPHFISKFEFLSFVKTTLQKQFSLVSLFFEIKETKDYVTSPRSWTCDFYVISLSPCGGGQRDRSHLDDLSTYQQNKWLRGR